MNIAARILNRVQVLFVCYTDKESYSAHLFDLRRTGSGFETVDVLHDLYIDRYYAKGVRKPVILVIYGDVVIQKIADKDSDLLKRIADNYKEFVSESSDMGDQSSFSFVRRDTIQPLVDQLDRLKVPVVHQFIGITQIIKYIDKTTDILSYHIKHEANQATTITHSEKRPTPNTASDENAAHLYARFFYQNHLGVRNIFALNPTGCRLASLISSGLCWPIILSSLGFLLLNYPICRHYGDLAQERADTLSALHVRRNASQQEAKRKQKLMAMVDRTTPYTYSYILDRTACNVPPEVILQYLHMEPPSGPLKSGKTPQIRQRTMRIGGTATDPESITMFSGGIGREKFATELRLTKMSQNSSDGRFTFEIEVGL